MTGSNIHMDASADMLFGANTSSILTPEITDGPYYVTGEVIRQNVKEALYSDGVDIHLEVQYIDVETCEPVPDIAVDIWGANATGVYSGISVSGNYATGGYNSTYLRCVTLTETCRPFAATKQPFRRLGDCYYWI
jgi:protocatechuate 3,4-dioxygenase beta subunit